MAQRGEAVGDGKRRSPANEVSYSILNLLLRLDVDRRGGFVEDKHPADCAE